jgi:hypothetical protein
MAEKIFAEGVRTFKKHDKAPDFVLGKIVITPEKLAAFMDKNPSYCNEYKGDRQISLQITLSKDGALVAAVDTWKPASGQAASQDLPF